MSQEVYDYNVKCKTCRKTFVVQLFDSHEKNLFVVDKKDWFCDKCKKDYFKAETDKLVNEQKAIGFSELTGTAKSVSWGTKIREELINKVNYLKESLAFDTDEDKELSDKAFTAFFSEWHTQKDAKWWIDHRRMNVRDISGRISDITKEIQALKKIFGE